MQWDGPTWRSLRRLVTAPGKAAAEHFEATGEPRVHPIRLYLAINILFFFLAPWVNYSGQDAVISIWYVQHEGAVQALPILQSFLDSAIERSGIEPGLYRVLLDDRMKAHQGAWVWILIPFLGLAGFAVARKRRPFLVEHLVLATQLVSFFLVSLIVATAAARIVLAFGPTNPFWIMATACVILIWVVVFPCMIFKSLRSFFEIGRIRAGLMTLWMGLALLAGTLAYLVVLFGVSLLSLRGLRIPPA